MSNRFAIMGTAGYVAPKHLDAIHYHGQDLLAAMDISDSVGVLDDYFWDTQSFTSFERFDRHLYKLRLAGKGIDYMTICTPNHLHDAHCRYALRNGIHAICEKPLVLNPWNLEALQLIEEESNKHIYNIVQLRLHPKLVELKEKISMSDSKRYEVVLKYVTRRGSWYYNSWKGQEEKSGGITTNIGVHLFDLLLWIFGEMEHSEVYHRTHNRAVGFLQLKKAKVSWLLSTKVEDLPEQTRQEGRKAHRAITVNKEVIEFGTGLNDLHRLSYQKILAGEGVRTSGIAPTISLINDIRNAKLLPSTENLHSDLSL